MTLRLAMWSGPRNISTAMMRSWENRPDTEVVDEPFYACYLRATGIEHPMSDEVLATQSSDWLEVAHELATGGPDAGIYYQKQMTHHILPGVNLEWTRDLRHCFLVRDPFEVVNSYRQKRASVTTEDIGIIRQLSLYEEISAITGQSIPVIDAREVLTDPRKVLGELCLHLGLDFYEEMLRWPAGKRASDGAWAPHWYGAVEKSTGFAAYESKEIRLTADQSAVAEASLDAYEALRARGQAG